MPEPQAAPETTMEGIPPVESSQRKVAEQTRSDGTRADQEIVHEAKTVEAKDVNLYYGDFHAVADVSMRIEPNKVTALIGSSGCGKTTFLRSVNRMHELTPGAWVKGTVTIDSDDIYAETVDPVAVRR